MMMAKMTGCLQPLPPGSEKDQSPSGGLRQTPVQALTDECHDEGSYDPTVYLSFWIFFLFSKLSSVSKPIQSNWVAKWISITRPFHFNWALRRTQSVFCSKKGLGIWQIWQIVSIFPFMYSSVPKFLTLSLGLFFENFEKVNKKCFEEHIFALLSIFFFPDPHLLWWLMLLIWGAACLLDFPDSVETLKFVFQQFIITNWFWIQ